MCVEGGRGGEARRVEQGRETERDTIAYTLSARKGLIRSNVLGAQITHIHTYIHTHIHAVHTAPYDTMVSIRNYVL